MSSMIRCPRCKSETDASASKPGSIIKCGHCRGDMRVPDAPKEASAGGKAGGGRQSTLFRKMSAATVPGQRGRSASIPGGSSGGSGRGASERGRDLSGLYMGGGIAALIGVIVVIGLVMKGGKSPETPTKGGPRKEVARAPVQSPPPPVAPAPPVEPEKPPSERKKGAPGTWEPDAMKYVQVSVRPVPTDATAEKDGLNFIRTGNTDRINQTPFRYMPFVINSLVTEDRDLARLAFQALYEFCEFRKLYNSDGKNPIDMSWVNDGEYRAYIYSWMASTWWPQSASKLPDAPGNQAAVDRTDWVGLVRQLMGGAYHDESTPQGTAFVRVKNLGRAAWPKLAELIDHEELPLGRTAAQVLMELTKERKPLPNEQNRAEVKAAWMAWINQQK